MITGREESKRQKFLVVKGHERRERGDTYNMGGTGNFDNDFLVSKEICGLDIGEMEDDDWEDVEEETEKKTKAQKSKAVKR